ncbi:MAG: isopenicillin N synthase family oxygenase [Acidimicrobiia bacterium]|nr:isopenicillin N synthase family oxygenase [Acidimicrobiia bacterium]MYC45056.1 isopenicillin N synthase family oxygenase [Acidimicrobiia bacterium]MYI19444.1 isopenicillin N synthase family oxygenase [Acidimicrobiia bacterium]
MITIPVIDISPFENGGPAAAAMIAAVNDACEEHGFLVVAGHGIPKEVNEDMDRACRAFFGQSPEEKSRFTPANGDILRGWWGVGTMATAASLDIETPPDFMEYLGFGPELSSEQRADYARRDVKHVDGFFATNVWPDTEGLRDAADNFYAETSALGHRLMRILAVALDLPADWFADKFEFPASSLFINYYPATLAEPEPGRFRRGQHTDYGAVTVLYTDGESGLQVQSPDGAWVPVPVVPDTYVVNLGDLMTFWSNGRWRSSMHRVVCPADTSTDRLSIPLFFNPSLDALVQCVPTCLAPGEQPAEPIPAGEWIANKIAATT